MKKVNRVKSNDDFSRIIKTGRYYKNATFKLYVVPNDVNFVRVGIAVSKKIGNAVVRSTSRRKVRAICDLLINYNNNSLDIIVVVKDNFLNQSHIQNLNAFKELLMKFIKD